MSHRRVLLSFFCLSVVLVGCGDSPRVVLRDMITTYNEVGDVVSQIPDDPETAEEAAEAIYKYKIEPLKAKWEAVKKRIEGLAKLDKDRLPELKEALDDMEKEGKSAGIRLNGQFGSGGRLRGIVTKLRLDAETKAAASGLREYIDPEKRWPYLMKCTRAQDLFKPPNMPTGTGPAKSSMPTGPPSGMPSGGPPGGMPPGGPPGGYPGGMKPPGQ